MSKKRIRRTATLLLIMVMTCGSTSNVLAADAGDASTDEYTIAADEQQESPGIENAASMEEDEPPQASDTAVMEEAEENCAAENNHCYEDNSSPIKDKPENENEDENKDDNEERLMEEIEEIEETADYEASEDERSNQNQAAQEMPVKEPEQNVDQQLEWEPYLENTSYTLTVGNTFEIRVYFKTDSQIPASADSIPGMSCSIEGLTDAELACPDTVKTDGDGRYYRPIIVTAKEQGAGSVIITVGNSKLTANLLASEDDSKGPGPDNDYSKVNTESGTDSRKTDDPDAGASSNALDKKNHNASEEIAEDYINSYNDDKDNEILMDYFKSEMDIKESTLFERFIDRWHINDLHVGNYLLRNNKMVICDYAGWGW